MWQDRILDQLLSSLTLERLHDTELKTPADQDAFTTAELIERLTKTVFAELDSLDKEAEYTNRKPAISSLRRNLQRTYLQSLSQLALGNTRAPQDCQTIAYAQLRQLQKPLNKALAMPNLDDYTRAHVMESRARINKTLAAMMLTSP